MPLLSKLGFGSGNRTKQAAILGCGPAGIFAAQAFVEKGWNVSIFSKKRESEMFGAQYLHAPIGDLDGYDAPADLAYTLRGDVEAYQAKVYGASPVGFVSPQRLVGNHQVWDIRRAYHDGYTRFTDRITDAHVDPDFVWQLFADSAYDIIFNTIPLPRLCKGGHIFRDTKVWAIGDAPARGIYAPFRLPQDMLVECNGEPDRGWYRASRIFDHTTIEWPADRKPPIPHVAEVSKPIAHNCDCWITYPKFWTAGRYGRWDKAELSHMAYYRVKEEIR